MRRGSQRYQAEFTLQVADVQSLQAYIDQARLMLRRAMRRSDTLYTWEYFELGEEESEALGVPTWRNP